MLIAELPFETEIVSTVLGSRCRTIVSGAMTDGKLAIVHVEVEYSGVSVPEHTHDLEDEAFHVLEGSVRFTLGDKEVIVNAGETIFGPRGLPHSWIALEPSKIVVSVTPSGLEEMFVEIDALGSEQSNLAKVSEVCARYAISFTKTA